MLDIETKNPQVPEDQSEILSSITQDQVDGIAQGSFEMFAPHQGVVFRVADDRLDHITPFQFSADAVEPLPRLGAVAESHTEQGTRKFSWFVDANSIHHRSRSVQ